MKHDEFVDELESKISGEYDFMIKDLEIKGKKCTLAQIDLIGVKDNRCDIFEVKCSYRIHKARKQLLRAKNYFESPGKMFFYCGDSKELLEVS